MKNVEVYNGAKASVNDGKVSFERGVEATGLSQDVFDAYCAYALLSVLRREACDGPMFTYSLLSHAGNQVNDTLALLFSGEDKTERERYAIKVAARHNS